MARGAGAFGKIPSMGDFLRSNLSAPFVQTWDTWLQAGMLAARGSMGQLWDKAYLSAPIWRFTLPAGLASDRAMSGILMASIDRVGRQYPLTIALPHHGGKTALTHFANQAVFEQLENIALDALEDGSSRASLLSALETITLVEPGNAELKGGTYVGELHPALVMAANDLRKSQGDCALWSAISEGNHHLMATKGLPKGREMIGLFDTTAPVWNAETTKAHIT